MARTATALAAATLALILAGCSSPAKSSDDAPSGPTSAVTSPASDGGGGDVDCTALSGDDAATYTVGIQLLAQLRSQDVVDSMKGSVLTYDPEAMDRILTKLKSLAGHGVLGDPGPDVEFYLEANDKARDILAIDGPVPQSKFDDLIAFEGEAGDFITRQISISAAYDKACP